MSPDTAMLFSQMEPPPGKEQEFNEWYETDHIPARMALEGFVRARRFFAGSEQPPYLAIYEVESLDALATEPYLELKRNPSEQTVRMLQSVAAFTRYTCELIADTGEAGAIAPVVSVVAFKVPDEDEADFNDWYRFEHEPMLLKNRDWLRIRRYRVVEGEGGPWSHFAVHELADASAMDSPERAAARAAPVRARFADREWFKISGRWVYEQISVHERKEGR